MAGLFDTRNNLLTVLLIGAIGLLGIGMVAQMLLMGRVDINRIAPSGSSDVDEAQVDVPETGLAALDEYTAITSRPVFFSDRQLPVVEMPEEGDEALAEEELEEEPINELKATVAGIIITPDMRLAMVRDDAVNKTLVLREGMSLEGEQAAWKLDSIATRQVNFVSVDGRESLLELSVNTSGLTAGSSGLQPRSSGEEPTPEGERRQPRPSEPDNGQQTDARARAEEVRRRVAERRAELRAEAERRAKMQQQQRDN